MLACARRGFVVLQVVVHARRASPAAISDVLADGMCVFVFTLMCMTHAPYLCLCLAVQVRCALRSCRGLVSRGLRQNPLACKKL